MVRRSAIDPAQQTLIGVAEPAPTLRAWAPDQWPVSPDWQALVDDFWGSAAGLGLADFMRGRLAAGAVIYPPEPLRALAVTGLKRHPLIPDVPTFAELGYAGFDGVQWYGIVGPAKLPEKITARLNEEINKAINNPELKERLSAEAIQPMPMAPDAFGQYIRQDIVRWTKVAKERGIEID